MLTVATAARRFNLVDVSAARTALQLVDRSDDALLKAYIDRASDVIARACNRVFARETVVETFRPDQCRETLILARYADIAIGSVVENDTTLDAADYEVNPASGLLARLSNDRPCWWPTGKIVVTYDAGFTLPGGCPGALAQACLQLVKSYYLGGDRDPMVRSEALENVSSAGYWNAELPPDVAALLAGFRNRRLR